MSTAMHQIQPAQRPEIYSRICSVTSEIDAVGKNKKNDLQNYKFRSIDDIAVMLSPVLSRNEVFVLPIVQKVEREEKITAKGNVLNYTLLTVAFRFYAPDGSFVECVTVGEGMDSGDKSANKAMSAAYKYALIQTFCIPTEEKKDSEYEDHEHLPRSAKPTAIGKPQTPKPQPPPIDPQAPLPSQAKPGKRSKMIERIKIMAASLDWDDDALNKHASERFKVKGGLYGLSDEQMEIYGSELKWSVEQLEPPE